MYEKMMMTAFDPERIVEYFKSNDFTKQFADMKLPEVDTQALFDAQKKNMDALISANRAAAEGYQDLFKRQIAVFEETLEEAKKQMQAMDMPKLDAEEAKAKTEIAKAAFGKALENMQAVAESAHKANSEAFEIVSARVKDSVTELQGMMENFKK